MDLTDVLSGGSEYIRKNKPATPDMDRISEIVLEMKVITSESRSLEEHERRWREHIEKFVDFDSLAWQAMQVAFDIFQIRTAYDLSEVRRSARKNAAFIGTIQAVYDGFLLGATFERRRHEGEK